MTCGIPTKTSTTVIVSGKVRFPSKCIVCGQSSDLETFSISGKPHGRIDSLMSIFQMAREMDIPVHKKCGNILKKKKIWRSLPFIIISSIVCGFAFYFGLGRLVLIPIGIAAMVPFIIRQLRNPLPVEFTEKEMGRLYFEFRDNNYAKEFAALNSGTIADEPV